MAEYQVRYVVVPRSGEDESPVPVREAARLAGTTVAMVRRYCVAGLLRPAATADGSLAFDASGLRRLGRIVRLQRELELDMAAVEVVLHLRDQVRDVQRQMDALQREHLAREDELLQIIHSLRRSLSADGSWWE